MAAFVLLAVVLATAAPASAHAGLLSDIVDGFNGAADTVLTAFGIQTASVENASAVVDGDTFDSYNAYLTNEDGEYSTENIGRIWTDKTVLDGDRTLTGALEGQTIKKNADSDFLVSLSALSSTSNLLSENAQPLDIVLVLDTSGSMAASMSDDSYEATYSVSQNSGDSYFVRDDNGGYHLLTYWDDQNTWYYYAEDGSYSTYLPKTSASDNRQGRYTFYTTDDTRLNALKSVVNSFIDVTAVENDAINDANQRHRISVVTYAEGSTVQSNLTAYTSDNANSIKNTVNGLRASGSTYAHNGLSDAKSQLQNARADAQKVVIFFTDGEPNEGSGFWPNVAAECVNTAGEMKDAGALVYTIGVFEDADPSDTTSNFNVYMNGVSSNYPKASATSRGSNASSTWTCTLGDRAEGAGYYKAATNAEELNGIFSDIQGEISATRVPTSTQGGYNASGYIEFTDELGPYMELDDFNSIIYNNRIYNFADSGVGSSASVRVDADGNEVADDASDAVATQTTYTFTAQVTGNDVEGDDPNANLSDIIITVMHYDDASKGDVVRVSIPASLIPLREFNVDTMDDPATMTVSERYPIRVFYDVSVRDGIVEPIVDSEGNITQRAAIDNPDDDLAAYIEANTDAEGNVRFYSNAYTVGAENGETTAQFTPSDSNAFYYFAGETLIYTDATCQTRATLADVNAERAKYEAEQNGEEHEAYRTFYYQREFYTASADAEGHVNKATSQKKTRVHEFSGRNFSLGDGNWATDDGATGDDAAVHVNAKAHRVSYVANMLTQKVDANGNSTNSTGTAQNVLNPIFDDEDAGGQVTVHLGNNGRIAVPLPGTLTVSKTVGVAADSGLAAADYQNVDFSYTLNLTAPAGGELPSELAAIKTAADGTTSDVTLSAADGYAFTLKHGEQIVVLGLADGTAYTVSEDGAPGFTAQVVDVSSEHRGDGVTSAEGTIDTSADATASVAFTNTYSTDPVSLSTKMDLSVSKSFNNWTKDSAFTFQMSRTTPGDPLPGGLTASAGTSATIGIDNADGALSGEATKTAAFDDITFTKPGRYTYSIWEVTPDPADQVAGVSYSSVAYGLEVIVEDDGAGALGIASANLYRLTDESGHPLTDEQIEAAGPVEDGVAAFTNTYSADEAEVEIAATKRYTNTSDPSDTLQNNTFRFQLSQTEVADPMPAGATVDDATGLSRVELGNVGDSIVFRISYGVEDLGKTYTYALREVPGSKTGMTYDDAVYYVTVRVESTEVDGEAVIAPVVTYYDGEPGAEGTSELAGRPTFKNVYDPEDLVLDDDAEVTIEGQKTLTGRDAKDGEDFTFALSLDKDATAATIQDGVTFGTGDSTTTDGATATVSGAKNGEESSFTFGTITFSKVGTYVFDVAENAPDQDADGMTYDRHTAQVTVTVADRDGKLVLEGISYRNTGAPNSGDAANANAAAFTNTYKADGSTDYGTGDSDALTFTKTLTGRGMRAGEFSFTVTPEASDTVMADEAAAKLSAAGGLTAVSNPSDVASGTPVRMTALPKLTFDEAEKGTYVYLIDEVEPADDNADADGIQHAGVTYDQSCYRVTITVSDNGDGTIDVQHAIERVRNAEGTEPDTPTAVQRIGFTNTYGTGDTAFTTDPRDTTAYFAKVLSGRDWLEGDAFTFVIEPQDGAPAPERSMVTLNEDGSLAGTEDGMRVNFGFGKITFTKPGTYTYLVRELGANGEAGSGGTENGVSYDTRTATLTVTVTDNGDGTLSASTGATAANGTFTNIYRSTLDYGAAGGLAITKTLTGRDMDADQFTFTVTPKDSKSASAADAAAKLGISEEGSVYTSPAADDGAAVTVAVLSGADFTQADAGKVYTYEVAEKADGDAGYTYDDAVRTVTIETEDDPATGTLTVTTTVTGGSEGAQVFTYATGDDADEAAEVAFQNSYFATTDPDDPDDPDPDDFPEGFDGRAKISATKTLTGRAMDEGEFSFTVTDAQGNEVAHGTNAAASDGEGASVSFDAIRYNTKSVKQAVADGLAVKQADGAYLYTYTVSEDAAGLPDGVSAEASSFQVTVTVTDNGDGTMTAAVAYPEGSDGSLAFANAYRTEDVSLSISGAKRLELADPSLGATLADIEGAFTFTLSGSDGAPLPDATTAANDAAGNVAFGEVTFTQADAGKTYTYTVEETGEVGGIANGAAQSFTVEVVDNGDGTLSLVTDPAAGALFTITNTYSVPDKPSTPTDDNDGDGTADLTLTKTLKGRNLKEGEFAFQLTDAEGNAVSTGTNDAEGNVALSAITFSKPGTYAYTLSEVAGSAGGVTYDGARHSVIAQVVDAKDGSLSVTWKVDGEADAQVTYENAYAPASTNIVVGAGKVLTGAELAEGQFSFALTGTDGAPMPEGTEGDVATAVNDAQGGVVFPAIEYTEAGTYAYELAEVDDGQSGVTYDDTVFELVVSVKDDGEGHLSATYSAREQGGEDYLTELPVFENAYNSGSDEPVEPGSPEPSSPDEPAKPDDGGSAGLPQTGDSAPSTMVLGIVGAAGAVLVVAGAVLLKRCRG